MKNRARLCLLVPGAITLLSAVSASAQIVAVQSISYISANEYATTADATYGWKFTVNASPLSVTQLGLMDLGPSGFAEAHRVGLWDNGNNLIAEADFDAGQSGTLNNGFRYLSVTPVTLQSGQTYSIGVWSAGGADNVVEFAASATYASEITYLGSSYAPPGTPGSGFAAPVNTFGGSQGVFGPNLSFDLTPVPEPKEYAAVVGLALAAFAGWRRRRAK